MDVQCALHQWLCLLISERHCLNVTDVDQRADRVCPRCQGIATLPKVGEVSKQDSRDTLVGAILAEASHESSDGIATWDMINRRQSKAKWGSEKPGREVWIEILQKFHDAGLLCHLEVQAASEALPIVAGDSEAAPEAKRRRSWHGQREAPAPAPGGGLVAEVAAAAGPSSHRDLVVSKMASPPSPETPVALQRRHGTGTKAFPKYGVKPVADWPEDEFFAAASNRLALRAKFKGGNKA